MVAPDEAHLLVLLLLVSAGDTSYGLVQNCPRVRASTILAVFLKAVLSWSSGFLRCGSDGMELASIPPPGPCSEYPRLQIGAENSSFCGAKGRLAH